MQSVRKGSPPRSFMYAARALAYCGLRYARFPISPKCILMATNLWSKSIVPRPALSIRRVSFFGRFSVKDVRISVK